jgi:phosphatidylinositol alpha-1,6-mannosyltransferase
MRLLLISQDFPPDIGGTQTYSLETAMRLAEKCDSFAVLAPRVDGCEELDDRLPFEVHRIPASHNTMSVKMAPTLVRLARTQGFDTAFHVQWSTAPASMFARKMGWLKRVFVAAHGRELLLEPFKNVPPIQNAFDKLRVSTIRAADGLFPVSNYTVDLLKQTTGVNGKQVRVIANGTDPDRFRPMDATGVRGRLGLNGHAVLLTVGRLVQRKGIDLVLRALPTVREEVPNIRYIVAGDGPEGESLPRLAAHLGLDDVVRFIGAVPYNKLPDLYNACDLFVMPSRPHFPNVEGFGIVFLEANACGKPVVAARSGGIPDAVIDGTTGLLVEPDQQDELTDAIVHVLRNPTIAKHLGQNGRRRVLEEASWDHVSDRLYETMATWADS